MVTMSATKARTEFYRLINDEDEPVTITGKKGNKVLISEDDWRAVEETLYLESIPGLVESIHESQKSNDFVGMDQLQW